MTRNIFEEKISVWSNTTRSDANRCVVTIKQFLDAGSYYLSTPNMPTDIQRLRLMYDTAMQSYPTDPARAKSLFDEYKEKKKLMPLATMGGTFANGGLKEDMLTASKVLCLDIDSVKPTDHWKYEGKTIPNAHIKDWNLLKHQLSQLPFVSYISLSIGGHGLFLLIPIADENRHTDYWFTLEHLFQKNLNLTIDPNTKDITRPRFISYDPQPYVNDQAQVFDRILPNKRPTISVSRNYTAPATSTEDAVRKCVEEIERRSLDITSDYSQWIDIASALYNGLGEAGKEYFMRVSRFYPNANERDINYKWQKNKTRSKVGIGTFFDICAKYGIRYKDSVSYRPTPSSPPKPVPPPAPAEATTTAKIIPIPLFPEEYRSPFEDMTQQEFNEIFSFDSVQRAMSAPLPF